MSAFSVFEIKIVARFEFVVSLDKSRFGEKDFVGLNSQPIQTQCDSYKKPVKTETTRETEREREKYID